MPVYRLHKFEGAAMSQTAF